MTRVIHTGDTHVGYRQYHSPERRRDFLAAFEQVIADAIADDVDTVVHAGDLFHDRRPGLVDLQGVIAALRDLAGAGIPFLAVVGNHETKRDAQWLDLFEDLGLATRLGSEPVEVGNAAFYGLDFVARSRRADLDYEFAPSDADHAALVAHGLFEPFAHADWDTERLLRESTVDFDVLLLGDDHEPKREEVDGTLLTYCGSTERVSASERDERGYNIVSFESESGSGSESDGDGESGGNHDRNRVSVLRRGLDVTREFVFVDLELQEGEGEARGREAVRQYDPTDAVVVVTIEGDGDPVTPAAIEEFANERGALIARVNDRREVGEETESEVAFTDPDEAVRERVLAMSLSEAAREVDETVRDPQVANANVRETVERRVREYVDAGELSAFSGSDEGAAVTGSDPEPENVRKTGGEGGGTEIGTEADTDADTDADIDADTDADIDADTDTDIDPDTDTDIDPDTDTDIDPDTEADIDPDTDADIDPDTEADIDPDTDADIDPDTEADTGDDGDQMSVEEFL